MIDQLTSLQAHGFAFEDDVFGADAREIERRPTTVEQLLRRRGPYSTLAGIREAERRGGIFHTLDNGVFVTAEFDALLAAHLAAGKTRRRPPWRARALPRAALEDHPLVDIRVLQKRGDFRRGHITQRSLEWSADGGPRVILYLAIDLSVAESSHMKVCCLTVAEGMPKVTRQIIKLVVPEGSRRGRWLFADPGGRPPLEVLSLRGGLLASRWSQHLDYRSQMPSTTPPESESGQRFTAERSSG